jgi:signal transduction histidine kinase
MTGDRDRLAELAELGVVTASLLHELRQPLFAVKGRLQLASRGRPLEEDELAELVRQLEHVEELLEHYAGLGRPDDSWAELDLSDAVIAAVRMVAGHARRAAATVSVELAGPVEVRGRAVAMRQIVLNLVTNAVDAVAGQPRREVVVRTHAEGRLARIEVADTGPGLAEDVIARIFEPFVTTKATSRGTGLGLYIARKLVDEAGGTIRATPRPDGGTIMIVELVCTAAPTP